MQSTGLWVSTPNLRQGRTQTQRWTALMCAVLLLQVGAGVWGLCSQGGAVPGPGKACGKTGGGPFL